MRSESHKQPKRIRPETTKAVADIKSSYGFRFCYEVIKLFNARASRSGSLNRHRSAQVVAADIKAVVADIADSQKVGVALL